MQSKKTMQTQPAQHDVKHQTLPIKFTSHHVAFTVNDIDKATKFYHILGFNLGPKGIFFEYDSDEDKAKTEDDVIIRHLKNQNGFVIELFKYKNKKRLRAPALTLKEDLPLPGIKHLALKVDDLAAAHEYLHRQSIHICGKQKQGRTGIAFFFIQDPEGNYIEIVEDHRKAFA